MGIFSMSSIVLLPPMNHIHVGEKTVMHVGYVLSIGGLVRAAFSRNPGELILTQDIMFSVGGCTCFDLFTEDC